VLSQLISGTWSPLAKFQESQHFGLVCRQQNFFPNQNCDSASITVIFIFVPQTINLRMPRSDAAKETRCFKGELVRELSQKWSKSKGNERDVAGRECVSATIDLLRSIEAHDLQTLDLHCRVLAFPLANSAKMDDRCSFELMEAFWLVLSEYALGESSCFRWSKFEHLAKCCAHFCQGAAQHAMNVIKTACEFSSLCRIAKVMSGAVLPDTVYGARSFIAVDQANQLFNYTIDAALALCAKIELSVEDSVSCSSTVKTNDVSTASELRIAVLSLVAGPGSTYRPARCLEQLSKHMVQVCKVPKTAPAAIKLAEDVESFLCLLAPSNFNMTEKKVLDMKDIIRVVLWECECASQAVLRQTTSIPHGFLAQKLILDSFLEYGRTLSNTSLVLDAIVQIHKCSAARDNEATTKAMSKGLQALFALDGFHSELDSDVVYLEMLTRLTVTTLQAELDLIRSDREAINTSSSFAASLTDEITKLFNTLYKNASSELDSGKGKEAAKGAMLGRVLAKMQVDCLNTVAAVMKENDESSSALWQLATETLTSALHSAHLAIFFMHSLSAVAITFRASGNCLVLIPAQHLQKMCNSVDTTSICDLYVALTQCVTTIGLPACQSKDVAAAVDLLSSFQSLSQLLCSRTSTQSSATLPSARLLSELLALPCQTKVDQRSRLLQLFVSSCVRCFISSVLSVEKTFQLIAQCCKSFMRFENSIIQSEAESAELDTHSAEMRAEFLIGLVSEFAQRAAELVAVGDDTVQACVRLIQTCSGPCHDLVRTALEMHVVSYFHWARGTGASAPECQTVIEALKTLSVQLNPSLAPRIATVSAASKKKDVGSSIASKSIASKTAASSDFPRILNSALQIRVLLLLSSWSVPLTASREDARASDGTQGAAVYISSALKALRSVAEIQEVATVNESRLDLLLSSFSLHSVLSDSRSLFFMLELQGRISEQINLPKLLSQIGDATKRWTVNAAFYRTADDLYLLTEVQRLFNHYDLPSVIGRAKNAGKSLTNIADPEWHVKVRCFLEIAAGLLTSDAILGVDVEGLVNLVSVAEAALSLAVTKMGNSLPVVVQAVRSWVCLLVGKVKMIASGDLRSSSFWAKRALSMTNLPNLRTCILPGDARCCLETTLPRLEAVILTAEVYEMSGSLDSALSYVSEAVAMAKLGSRALCSIVSLHTLRIWHRTGSLRLVSCLQDMLSVDEFSLQDAHDDVTKACRAVAACLGPLIAPEDDDHVELPSVSEALAKLSFRYTSVCWDLNCLVSTCKAKSGAKETQAKEFITGNSSRNGFNTLLSPEFRLKLQCPMNAWESCVLLSAAPKPRLWDSLNPSAATIAPLKLHPETRALLKLLNEASQGLCFDAVRDLRRKCCLQVLGSDLCGSLVSDFSEREVTEVSAASATVHWGYGAMLAFILGASSCGVALECGIDNSHVGASSSSSSTDAKDRTVASHLSRVSELLRSACCADAAILMSLRTLLQQGLRGASSGKVPPAANMSLDGATMVFFALESSTGNLLLGRLGAAESWPLVVSLPISAAIKVLLQQWEAVMESSKAALQKTMNTEVVKKWSDKEKKAWWGMRQRDDELISSLLNELQDLLGPWRCLLRGDSHAVAACSLPSSVVPLPLVDWVDVICNAYDDGAGSRALTRDEKLAALTVVAGGDSTAALNYLDAYTRCLQTVAGRGGAGLSFDTTNPPPAGVENDSSDIDLLSNELSGLKVTELRRRLKEHGLPGEGPKKDLVARLLTAPAAKGDLSRAREKGASVAEPPASPHTDSNSKCSNGGHMVLILDEALQSLPWECMPILRSAQCSRVPSLALMLAMLHDKTTVAPLVRLQKTWFAIDPEGNLPDTRKTMETFLAPYARRWAWSGVVGSSPSESLLR